jgi:uncharacterized membrane protein
MPVGLLGFIVTQNILLAFSLVLLFIFLFDILQTLELTSSSAPCLGTPEGFKGNSKQGNVEIR